MSVKPFMGKGANQRPVYKAGLRPNHIVIAVNGESPDYFGRDFVGWFKLKFSKGDTVTYTVLEGKNKKEIKYTLE